jgi:hypothetical protein
LADGNGRRTLEDVHRAIGRLDGTVTTYIQSQDARHREILARLDQGSGRMDALDRQVLGVGQQVNALPCVAHQARMDGFEQDLCRLDLWRQTMGPRWMRLVGLGLVVLGLVGSATVAAWTHVGRPLLRMLMEHRPVN